MGEHCLGIADSSKDMVKTLFDIPQSDPTGTIFDADVFAAACRQLTYKNEASLIRDLTPLIVPSAESWLFTTRTWKILLRA